jgi:molybdopterin-containing oxidoreductase family iron-sulfur binding subunit
VPFLVSFSPFLDEYTANSDLILPDHTYLERFQYQGGAEAYGYGILGLRHPVVDPVFDTMDSADVFIRLARELGGTVSETLPFKDNSELIESALSTLTPEERGALDRDGVIAKPPYKFGNYTESFLTPSKKFEFDSGNLRQALAKLKMSAEDIASLGIEAEGDIVYLPHYEPIRYAGGSPAEYPLILNTYKLAVRGEGRLANAPFLSEIMSPLHDIRWDSWVEIHPDTAEGLGIVDGDSVTVESTIARVTTRARVFAGAEPGTVSIPHHFGHRGYGHWAEGRGVNPNDLIPPEYDYLCGQAAFPTRVKVYSAGGDE